MNKSRHVGISHRKFGLARVAVYPFQQALAKEQTDNAGQRRRQIARLNQSRSISVGIGDRCLGHVVRWNSDFDEA